MSANTMTQYVGIVEHAGTYQDLMNVTVILDFTLLLTFYTVMVRIKYILDLVHV